MKLIEQRLPLGLVAFLFASAKHGLNLEAFRFFY